MVSTGNIAKFIISGSEAVDSEITRWRGDEVVKW